MNIRFDWPASGQTIALTRDLTAEKGLVFDVSSGVFGSHDAHLDQDAVMFYWHMARPVMLSLCNRHVCLLDGVDIPYGSIHPLHNGSKIQAGHFELATTPGEESLVDEQTFYRLIYPDGSWQVANKLPEIEDVLPNGGNCINDLRYVEEVILAQNKDANSNVLKTLEVEYKRFLIWQEQDGVYYGGMSKQADHIIKRDYRFEQVSEQIKDKTLTECIVSRDFLMEKVWPELEQGEYTPEIFIEDEKTDLLRSLSPEHIVAKSKYKVPELVFHYFYKVGLDSHY